MKEKIKMFLKFVANVCRVCLGGNADVDLFESSGNDEKFKACTRLEISKDDGLPASLCEACYENLKTSYEFQKRSIESDQQLRTFVTSINTQFAATVGRQQNVSQESKTTRIPTEITFKVDETLQNDTDGNNSESMENSITEISVEIENPFKDESQSANNIETTTMEIEELQELEEDETELYEVDESEQDHLSHGNNEIPTEEEKIELKYINSDSNICIECNKSFANRSNLLRHVLSHSKVKPYKCNICDGTFTQNGSLRQHMRKHTGERPYQCEMCEKRFTRKRLLDMHVRTHTGEKPFYCDECNLSFTVKEGLRRHNLSKHMGLPKTIHTCVICRKKLHSKYTLNMHMKLHGLNKRERFKCQFCNKSFLTRYSAEHHEQSHQSHRTFSCHVCLQLFESNADLKEHLKQHEHEEEIQSDNVQKNEENLCLVSREDEDDSNFECKHCNKTFTLRLNFLQHLEEHTKASGSFTCNQCNISYNTNRNLKLHLANFHKEVVTDLNTCEICAIPFVKASDLNQHILEVHDSIDEHCTRCAKHFTSKVLYQKHCLEHDLFKVWD